MKLNKNTSPDPLDKPNEAFEGLSHTEKESLSDVISQLDKISHEMPALNPERMGALRIHVEKHIGIQSPSPKLFFLREPGRRSLAIAASFIGLLIISYAWFAKIETIHAPTDKAVTLALDDGSIIDINAGSSISYRPGTFRWSRNVTLQGEAFFNIAHHDTPFTVLANPADITVLGTQFNVINRQDTLQTLVYLYEGSVKLSLQNNSAENKLMNPGEVALVTQNQATLLNQTHQKHSDLPLWREKQLSFSNIPLSEVLTKIESQYALNISVSDDVNLTQEIYYLTKHTMTAETLIADLCRVTELSYRPIFNGFEIFSSSDATNLQ